MSPDGAAAGGPLLDPAFLDLAMRRRDDPERTAEALMDLALGRPDLAPALCRLDAAATGRAPSPCFDLLDGAGRADPERRSVVFIGHCYYGFLYLAAALRRRGWDAVSLRIEPLDDNAFLFHGEDLSLVDDDPLVCRRNLLAFYRSIPTRFRMVHFYAERSGFLPENVGRGRTPWDLIALKGRGVRVGYSHFGCKDLVSRTSFERWSGGAMCACCSYRDDAAFCSDEGNLAWGRRVTALCDLICAEADPALDHKAGPAVHREPLTCALDPTVWRPGLAVPDAFRLAREADEILIFHAVSHASRRTHGARNVKGSHAVVEAVDALRAKGLKVRLIGADNLPNIHVRFLQAQADIVVEQLLYGRHGATLREAMMLGRPVVVHINPDEGWTRTRSAYLDGLPHAEATPATVAGVLEELVRSPERRAALGAAARAHALEWWSADACAERYERVYDRIMAGLPPAG